MTVCVKFVKRGNNRNFSPNILISVQRNSNLHPSFTYTQLTYIKKLTYTTFALITNDTILACETQMPPIMVNSKDGKVHKDRYLDTIRTSLTHKMLVYNMKTLISIMYLLLCIDFCRKHNKQNNNNVKQKQLLLIV